MGNTLVPQNTTESINWKNINTDSMTSDEFIKHNNRPKIEQLVQSIKNSAVNSENDFLDQIFENKYLSSQNDNLNENNDSMSDTSPFISSEMYQYIVDKENEKNNQTGGGKCDLEADSATSTSSTGTKRSIKKMKGGKVIRKQLDSSSNNVTSIDTSSVRNSNVTTTNNSNASSSIHELKKLSDSENDYSYLSSSAHTNGEYSNIESDSANSTSRSVEGQPLSQSIHTSEINMVNF